MIEKLKRWKSLNFSCVSVPRHNIDQQCKFLRSFFLSMNKLFKNICLSLPGCGHSQGLVEYISLTNSLSFLVISQFCSTPLRTLSFQEREWINKGEIQTCYRNVFSNGLIKFLRHESAVLCWVVLADLKKKRYL